MIKKSQLTLYFFLLIVFSITAQHDLINLVPSDAATHKAIQSGDWSLPATWEGNSVPDNAAIVHIPADISVTYKEKSNAHFFALRVDGTLTIKQTSASDTTRLIFDTFVGTHTSNIKIKAENATDGFIDLQIKPFDINAHKAGNSGYAQNWNTTATNHFEDSLITYQIEYTVGPKSRFNAFEDIMEGDTYVTVGDTIIMEDGLGVLGRYSWDSTQLSLGLVTMGKIEILGQEKGVMTKLSANALKNQNLVKLDTLPNGWKIGDQILITSGGNKDATSNGSEIATIAAIDGTTITTTANLAKNHEGRMQDDLHCYVGDMTRNIRFKSTDHSATTRRGHFMVMHNPTSVNIKNAAFLDMGRTDKSRILDDLIWEKWVKPKVFKSKISALGQECSQLKLNPKADITNHRGRYSIHLHKLGTAYGTNMANVTGNVVWGNPGWGIAHHGSHADISQNVVYDVTGSGIVSEAGNETGFWDNNLVVDIKVGHDVSPYTASLFYDDYLFTGQGLGMKGRAVVCRGNVIADANFAVGVINFNAAINSLSRMDSESLAKLRPGFEIDQFPMSQNGYSIEGDSIMPLEVALIMKNTTIINSVRGLRSIERDMGVNHESRSVFDGFKAWGVSVGIGITYQADYSFRDVFISGKNDNSVGLDLWKHSHNHSFERIKLADLQYGITASKLVESGNGLLKTRNNGFTPWLFVDLDTSNVEHFYKFEKEDPDITANYNQHPDNPIIISSSVLPSTRQKTFTLNDSADLVVDLALNDLQFKVDGAVNDRTGTYEYGIKQAEAQGDLRLDYPERIYEFVSQAKLEAYLAANDLFKDTANNDQLYFIVNEIIVDRTTFEPTTFPIRVKILNAPNTTAYSNPKIEDPANLLPTNQLLSRAGTASQSSTSTTTSFEGESIDPLPERAIDGNNSGRLNVNLYQRGLLPVGSSAITKMENEPWWELDLGATKIIEYIDIWNTLEMHGDQQETPSTHFKDFYVLISDTPFGNVGLSAARAIADDEYYKDNSLTQLFSLNELNTVGRYVRIQAVGNTIVGLAEVDIIGRAFSGVPDCNGDLNGLAYIDNCGTCVKGNTGVDPCERDCNNEWGGTANFDNCGTCVGGTTGKTTPVEITCNGIDDDCDPATLDAPVNLDDDGDGVCNDVDICANGPDTGMPCDDGNPCTINDIIDTYCNCIGTISAQAMTTNIALGKTVTQSSTKEDGLASRAIDGNTDGDMNNNSVTFTNSQDNAWWEIDLGNSIDIYQINLFNRTDCCTNRLTDFYVLVSATPFVSTTLTEVLNQSGVSNYYVPDKPDPKLTIGLNQTARYIRVQLNKKASLSLAEVEIIAIGTTTLYKDADGDGYGDNNNPLTMADCDNPPMGYVLDNTDFNDTEKTAYPGATEICDGIDNNNDGQLDEDTDYDAENKLFQSEIIPSKVYTASASISTNQNVSISGSSTVSLFAGQHILLKPGFSVANGATFNAKIVSTCGQNNAQSFIFDNAISDDKNYLKTDSWTIAPNPFNDQTTIQVYLAEDTPLVLNLYNATGQLMNQIVNFENAPKGWVTVPFTKKTSMNGLYYVQLITKNKVATKKVMTTF